MITSLCLVMLLVLPDSLLTVVIDSDAGPFRHAVSVARAADGTSIVADHGENSVSVWNGRNERIRSIGGTGWGSDAFQNVTDVTSSFLLDIYVTDANNRRVLRFDRRFDPVQELNKGSIGPLDGSFQPVACATASTGKLYILESDERRILELDARGKVTGTLCASGTRGPVLTEPKDIAVDDEDRIVVLDGAIVQIIDRFGNGIGSIALDPAHRWTSVACGPDHILAVAPDRIEMIGRTDARRMTITPAMVLGMETDDPFADVAESAGSLNILTAHRLLRCRMP